MPVVIPGVSISTAGAFSNAFSPAFDARVCYCCLTGTAEDCDCSCCPDGYWTEYTFTLGAMTDGLGCFGGDCTGNYSGTWTVKYRGACIWTTDEPAGPCQGNNLQPEKYKLFCVGGTFSLLGDFQTVYWTTSNSDFCIDGADAAIGTGMDYQSYDLSAACFLTGVSSIPPTLNQLTVTPGGAFVPCP